MSGAFGRPQAAPLLVNTVISQPKKVGIKTHFKVIGSGKIIEIYQYSKNIFVNHSGFPKKLKVPSDAEILDILTNPEKYSVPSVRSQEYKQRNIIKAKNRIRRLVQANFDQQGKFLTFSFAKTTKVDITSLTDCHVLYARFMRSLRDKYPNFRYVAVPEFQKRGAVHYHAMVDVPYTPWKTLMKLWQYGGVYITKINNPAYVGSYIAKYVGKALEDKRYSGHRCFYSSKNLIQPVVKYGDDLQNIMQAIEARGITPSFTNSYYSDWCGQISYKSYNLYQTPAQSKGNL